jgi:hypothetical protein
MIYNMKQNDNTYTKDAPPKWKARDNLMDRNNELNDRKREDNENENWLEEAAAEVIPLPNRERGRSVENTEIETDNDVRATEGRGIGWFAFALSIASLFFLPVLLGSAGIIVGFVARRRGANALGNWSIGIGAASIIVSLLFAPFF